MHPTSGADAADYGGMKLWLPVLALLAALGVSERGLTASNAVSAQRAGGGAGAISGYVVSGVSYGLDDERIVTVSFDLDPAGAGTVRVRLGPAGSWHACDVVADGVTCALDEPISSATSLDVVATG